MEACGLFSGDIGSDLDVIWASGEEVARYQETILKGLFPQTCFERGDCRPVIGGET